MALLPVKCWHAFQIHSLGRHDVAVKSLTLRFLHFCGFLSFSLQRMDGGQMLAASWGQSTYMCWYLEERHIPHRGDESTLTQTKTWQQPPPNLLTNPRPLSTQILQSTHTHTHTYQQQHSLWFYNNPQLIISNTHSDTHPWFNTISKQYTQIRPRHHKKKKKTHRV